MKFEWARTLVRRCIQPFKFFARKKNRGEKIHSLPGLKLLIGTTKELRSRYRDIWKLVFLFLRGRLFLGGLLSFFLSCHID